MKQARSKQQQWFLLMSEWTYHTDAGQKDLVHRQAWLLSLLSLQSQHTSFSLGYAQIATLGLIWPHRSLLLERRLMPTGLRRLTAQCISRRQRSIGVQPQERQDSKPESTNTRRKPRTHT